MKALLRTVLAVAMLPGCTLLAPLELQPPTPLSLPIDVTAASLFCLQHQMVLRFILIDSSGKVLKAACDTPTPKGLSL